MIPFETNGETIYLSPDSAEGKALSRINAIDNGQEIEWIVVEPTEDIDIQTIRERAQKRGYKINEIQR